MKPYKLTTEVMAITTGNHSATSTLLLNYQYVDYNKTLDTHVSSCNSNNLELILWNLYNTWCFVLNVIRYCTWEESNIIKV